MGRTVPTGQVRAFSPQGTGYQKGNVYGTYIHGIFDKGAVASTVIKALGERKGISMETMGAMDYDTIREREFDRLSSMLREHMDMGKIYGMLREIRLEG